MAFLLLVRECIPLFLNFDLQRPPLLAYNLSNLLLSQTWMLGGNLGLTMLKV